MTAAYVGCVLLFPFSNGASQVNEICDAVVDGAVYTGLIPSRDEDVIGMGFARAELFQGGTNEESVVELFYKAAISPRLSIQPDLQYIASPSGIHRDALAVGFRLQMALYHEHAAFVTVATR